MRPACGKRFGYDAWVVVLTAARVAALVEACPYPSDDASTHTYLTLASDTDVLSELYESGSALDGTEMTRLGPEALAWLAPTGGTLDSPFSKLSVEAEVQGFHHHPEPPDHDQGPRRGSGAGAPR